MGRSNVTGMLGLTTALTARNCSRIGRTEVRHYSSRRKAMTRPFNLSMETLKYLSTPEPEDKTGNLLRGITLPTPDQRSTFFTAECFEREDESDDSDFYNEPRFVTHIDDKATEALTLFYTKTLPDSVGAHLDLCSSWVSFLPAAYSPARCV